MATFIFSNLPLILYFVIFITSMLTYRRYFDTVLKGFPMYIAYTFFTELLGYLIFTYKDFSFFTDESYHWYNVIIYNIYNILVLLYFSYVFYRQLQGRIQKKIALYGGGTVLLSYFISCCFQNPMYTGLYYASTLQSILMVVLVLLYFKEKLKARKAPPLKHNLMFWVSLGLIIFHSIFPFLYLTGFLKPEIWIAYRFRDILKVLIIISYSQFLIGLLLGRRSAFR